MKGATREQSLAREFVRTSGVLGNAAQFNLIKAARQIRANTRVCPCRPSVPSSLRPAPTTRIDIEEFSLRCSCCCCCCCSVSRGRRHACAKRRVSFLSRARAPCLRELHFRLLRALSAVERISRHGRLETAFTCKTFQEVRAARTAPRRNGDLYTRWVIAPGTFLVARRRPKLSNDFRSAHGKPADVNLPLGRSA